MKISRTVLLTLFVVAGLCFAPLAVHSEAAVTINGTVFDVTTSLPIEKAVVELGDVPIQGDEWRQIENTTTDDEGCFTFRVRAGETYGILTYFNDSTTQGFDYAPRFTSVLANGNTTLQLPLHPAMSIVFLDDLLFVGEYRPSDQYSYTILANESGEGYIQSYGTSPPSYNFLDLLENYVIVPVDRSFELNLSARMISEEGRVLSHSFVIRDIGESSLVRGALLEIDVRRYSTRYNLDLVSQRLGPSEQQLADIKEQGFYAVNEEQVLMEARTLLEVAEAKLSSSLYDAGYADIVESYLRIVETDKRLGEIHANALSSILILIMFVNLTAIALAYFIFERPALRYVAALTLFVTLFIALYLVYPAFRLISPVSLLWNIAISLGISLCGVSIGSTVLGEVTTSLFSLAKRNLKKRKLRFSLTLISVTILVMSFVSLTSFTSGYGLVTKTSLTSTSHPPSLLLKRPLSGGSETLLGFLPLDHSTVSAIQHKQEVEIVVPKQENRPTQWEIGTLSSSTQPDRSLSLLGIVGIVPSLETNVTHIDRTVVQGRYLNDDENSVLISINAANTLGVSLNDELTISTIAVQLNVTVVGLLDDAKLSTIKEVNGEAFLPQKMMFDSETETYYLKTCSPEEVAIVPLGLASTYGALTSRMNIVLKDWDAAPSFSRQIALERGLAAYYSSGNTVHQIVVESYLEAKGLPIFIPWSIAILSVVITLLNAIYEQRKDIAVLSSIGLNPSHIMGLFVAQASIIGLVGGASGYLLGLGNYKLMSALFIVPEVQAKVSAVWCLASISFAMATVIVGAIVALRSSVIVTPSLIRRWYLEPRVASSGNPSASQIPMVVREEDIDSMFDFVIERFESNLLAHGADLGEGRINRVSAPIEGRDAIRVRFDYILGRYFGVGGYPFELIAKKIEGEKAYRLEVVCKGIEENVRSTTTYIRLALIAWSSQKK